MYSLKSTFTLLAEADAVFLLFFQQLSDELNL